MCDQFGQISSSVPGLANRAQVSIEQTEKALKLFLNPDKYSRTKDNEGRRIGEIDSGWVLLNHEKYREARNENERKEYKRQWMKEFRDRKREHFSVDNVVDKCGQSGPPWTHTDTDTDTYTDIKIRKKERKKKTFTKPTIEELNKHILENGLNLDAEVFYYFYQSKSWMIGKNKMCSWKSALQTWNRKNLNHDANKPTRAKRVNDKLKKIGMRDGEKNGYSETLD